MTEPSACYEPTHDMHFVKGIVTTRKITVDAWQDEGIEFVGLYPRQASPGQVVTLLAEVLTTLEHARKFVATREKMHPDGVKLYDDTTCEVITALYAARALGKADGMLVRAEYDTRRSSAGWPHYSANHSSWRESPMRPHGEFLASERYRKPCRRFRSRRR